MKDSNKFDWDEFKAGMYMILYFAAMVGIALFFLGQIWIPKILFVYSQHIK